MTIPFFAGGINGDFFAQRLVRGSRFSERFVRGGVRGRFAGFRGLTDFLNSGGATFFR